MNLKTIIKNSLFIKSLSLAKSNPTKIGLMVLFDVLFLVSFLYVLPKLASYFSQSLTLPQTYTTLFVFFILSLLYYLLALLVYSFFKYGVLDFIKSLFEKTEFSFNRFGWFYLLNVIIFLPTYILFSFILQNIKAQFQPLMFFVLGVPLSLILYVIANMAHSLFYQGGSLKDSLKKGFILTFTKFKTYRETIFVMILFAFALGLLFLGSGYLIRLIASRNYVLYLNLYGYLRQVSIIVFDLVFYFIILINRISFYAVIKEIK